MTDWVPWFRHQLRASGEAFAWAITQIDSELLRSRPPQDMASFVGDWPPLRHVWHLTYYERCMVLPAMRECAGGPPIPDDPCPDWENWEAFAGRSVEELVADFHAIRAEQIALLDELADADWTTPRETPWGMQPMAMIVTKTLQHTFEHADTLLRMALWWRAEDGSAS